MKTLFSLKSRIEAILTVAALLATAMPMTGFAATAKEAPELLVNGNFKNVTTEALTFGSNSQITIDAGMAPTDWDITFNEDNYVDTEKAYVSISGTNINALAVMDNSLTVSQKVKGIQPGEFYTLSFDASTRSSSSGEVIVNFLNYDEEAGTYKTIYQYVTDYNAADEDESNDIALTQASVGSSSDKVDYTSVKYAFRCGAADGSKPLKNYKLNFVAPPYTNAVEVVCSNPATGRTSSTYQVLFDNMSLKLGAEVVNNGNFQAFTSMANGDTVYNSPWWQGVAVFEADETATYDPYERYKVISNAKTDGVTRGNSTYLLLNENSDYRITFKYKHTIGDNVADKTPFISLQNGDIKWADIPVPTATKIGTDGDWGIYEAYFTTPAAVNGTGLVNISLSPATRALAEGESWDEGYAVYYDDISIVEAPTMNINTAGGIDVSYTSVFDDDTADLVVAKYDKVTGELEDIDIVTIGADADAGVWTKYTEAVSLTNSVKVFLWDGIGTMKPVANSVARPSYTKTVPYKWVFDTADYVPTLEDGIGYNATGDNGSVSVTDKGLALSNSALDGIKDSHRIDFNFDPVSTGKLYAELKFVGQQTFCHDGLAIISDANGNRIAGVATEGRGANSAKVWQNTSWSAKDVQNVSWKGGAVVKLELDFTTGKYKVYQKGTQLASTSLGNEFALPAGASASKLTFNYSNNGDYLEYVKLYTEEVTATQTETAYTMNVGDTQQAGITYEPATGKMYDMKFASSNTAIAEVTADGLITAKRAGTATITATSAFYDVNYEYVVTIPETVTVTPVTLNYVDNFTSAQEIKDLAGWSILNRQANTVLATADGKLVATGVAVADKATGAAQAKLKFDAVSSGKLVIEVEYGNPNGVTAVSANAGLLNIYASDGTKIAGLRADGTGASHIYDAGALVKSTTRGRDLGLIKFEIDLTAKTYQVWKNEKAVASAADATKTSFALSSTDNLDVSSFEFTFTNEGDYIDNVKVYVPEA